MNGTQHMNLQQRSLEWYNSLTQQDLGGIKERIGFAYRALENRMCDMDTPRPQEPVTLMHRDRLVTMFDLHEPYNLAVRVPLKDDPLGEYMGFDKSIARADMTTMFESNELTPGIVVPVQGQLNGRTTYSLLMQNFCDGELQPLPEDLQYAVVNGSNVLYNPILSRNPEGTYEGPIITL